MRYYQKNGVEVQIFLEERTDIFILFRGFPARHSRQKAHSDRAELQLENNSAAASPGIIGRMDNLELR